MDSDHVKNPRNKVRRPKNVREDKRVPRKPKEKIIVGVINRQAFKIDIEREWISLDKVKIIKKIFHSLLSYQIEKRILPYNQKQNNR